jgi:GntR family transcriptional regulator/MocR family aminotransferase
VPKDASSFDLALNERPRQATLNSLALWRIARAILGRRLQPGTRLPATRDFAQQYNVSRGTVVTAFEQLQAEGYLVGMVGAGTWVNERLPEHLLGRKMAEAQVRKLPGPVPVWALFRPARPFRPYEPAISEFPIEIWARVAGRRAAPSLHFAFGRG